MSESESTTMQSSSLFVSLLIRPLLWSRKSDTFDTELWCELKSLFLGDEGFAFGAGFFLVFGAEEDTLAAAGDNLKDDFSMLQLPSTATFSSMPTIFPSRRMLE